MFRNYELMYGYLREQLDELREEQKSINLNLLIAFMDGLEVIAENGGFKEEVRE